MPTLRLFDYAPLICTRFQVEKLPLEGVTEIDFVDVKFIGASAMDELIARTPGARFVNMDEWSQSEFEWVMGARRKP